MAQLILNVGANANDGTGDTLRAAMIKVNSNFTELYNSPLGASSITISGNKINANASNADLELMPNGTGGVAFPAIRFDDNNIVGTRSNENINLLPAGTGKVVFGSIGIAGTTLSSDDSSSININEGLIVDGTANISGNVTLTGAVTMESTLEVTGNTTLANLTVTGTSTFGSSGISVDNLNINDNIISSDSNADIILSPGGTGSVVIGNLTVDSNINIQDNVIKTTASNSDLQLSANGTGVVDIASALTTAAVTTVGDWSVTGTHTISGQLDVDYVRIKDNAITTNASSANLEISANGSGVVKIDDADIGGGNIDNTVIGANTAVAGTFTTVTATTSIVIDGVTIADNTVSTNASNSNLEQKLITKSCALLGREYIFIFFLSYISPKIFIPFVTYLSSIPIILAISFVLLGFPNFLQALYKQAPIKPSLLLERFISENSSIIVLTLLKYPCASLAILGDIPALKQRLSKSEITLINSLSL